MEKTPSLLDWLTTQWGQPLVQRLFRFGLAALAAGVGLFMWLVDGNAAGMFLLGLAMGLAVWGASVRGANTPIQWPQRGVEAALPAEAAPAPEPQAPVNPLAWVAPLRLPAALFLPILGQLVLSPANRDAANVPLGLAFYALGLAAFAAVVRVEGLFTATPEAAAAPNQRLGLRRAFLGVSLLTAALTFVLSGDQVFTTPLLLAWAASVVCWLAAAWEGNPLAGLPQWGRGLAASAREGHFTLRVDWAVLFLLAALVVGAYFRFADIEALPPEMNSDHVEKLLDVADVLDGQHKIYFERNTGREPFQFYWTAWITQLLNMEVSYLPLKLGTALLGFLTLPFVYLLGRELEDETLGLLAVALTAMSFWATAISRVGLRFPLYPVFVAPTLYFLLRGLRRNSRNDFLLAGLALGVGLHGYSPFRIVPFVALALVAWYLLWPAARGRRLNVLVNTGLAAVTMALVFMPLARFWYDKPEMFWYRTSTRLGETESAIQGAPLAIFLDNQWRALLMFNWRGDEVWVNTLRERPVMDAVTGALLILGVGFVLARLVLKRDWTAGALLAAVPMLLLPSTLALAFPNENPSVVRAGGAIPVLFVLAAYPLWLVVKRVRVHGWGGLGVGAAAVTVGGLLLVIFTTNQQMYFREYRQQYLDNAQNASEIGAVIRDYARTFGSYDTAWVRGFPHWADTRAVGMYSGNFRRDYYIEYEDLAATQADPRPKLFILNREDVEVERPDGKPPTLPELRRLFPNGQVSTFVSARSGRDFLVYFVPAQAEAPLAP